MQLICDNSDIEIKEQQPIPHTQTHTADLRVSLMRCNKKLAKRSEL